MLLQLAVGVIIAYGGIVGVMYLTQRSNLTRTTPDVLRLWGRYRFGVGYC